MSRITGAQKLWIALGAITLIIAVLIIGWVQQLRSTDDGMPQGGPVELPSTIGDFALADLGDDQVAVLFFGYTYCPDVCPMSLSVMRQTLARLGEAERERVVPVMISVDPERDDLARLEEYVGHFGPQFIGATGNQRQLGDIAERYGIFWRKVESNSAMGYTVDHSASLFIVDNDGNILRRVMYSPVPNALNRALDEVLIEVG